jgi:multidrug efflux pump subunit AcrA (membrane-fusion protein)
MINNNQFDTDPLQPLDSDDFLPPIGRLMKLSGLVLLATFVAAIALAAVTRYSTTVKASGTVRPARELQIVAAPATGTIKSVDVDENQVVKPGDVIARIDETPLRNRLTQLQKYINGLENQQEQLKSQIYRSAGSSGRTPPRGINIDELNFPNAAPQIHQFKKNRENLKNAQKEVDQLNQSLENTIVRTPVAGTVLKLDVENVGKQVKSGEEIAQIVPSGIPLVVKANVPVDEIAQVQVGHPVQLRVSAYPYPEYGTIRGKVSAIAPDAVTAQNQNNDASFPSTASFYEVTIQPDQTFLTRRDRQYSIQPGMGITAAIISREETVLTFMLRKARLTADL